MVDVLSGFYCGIIIAYSGGVKQQERAENGPFDVQVKQTPGDKNIIKNFAKFSIHGMWRHVEERQYKTKKNKKTINIGSINSFCNDVWSD